MAKQVPNNDQKIQDKSYPTDNITAVTASPATEEIDLCELYWSEGLYNKHQGNFFTITDKVSW